MNKYRFHLLIIFVVTLIVVLPSSVNAIDGCTQPGYCGPCSPPGPPCWPDPTTPPPACFLPGTKVDTPSGEKNIEDIKTGDDVTSFDKADKVVDSSVTSIYKFQRDFYFDLKAGDYEVKASAEHPFYVGNGVFKEIQYLQTGDTIFTLNKDKILEKKTVTSNQRVNEKTDVYNHVCG